MYARIVNGVVVEMTEESPVLGPYECACIVECDDDCEVGWHCIGGVCEAPTMPTAEELLDAAFVALDEKYAPLLESVRGAWATNMLADGLNEAARTLALRARYAAIVAAYDAEVDQIFGGL